jgi:hypothetical protein
MKMLAAAASGGLIAGFFVVMHADTPWFGAGPLDSFSIAAEQVTIGLGQSVVIGSVPNNKRLTITDAAASPTFSGYPYMMELDEQDATGAITVKVPEGFVGAGAPFSDALTHSNGHGVVFGPGTSLVLKYESTAPTQFIGSYFIRGYWTDK